MLLIESDSVPNFPIRGYNLRSHDKSCFHVRYFVQAQFQSQNHFLLSVTTLINLNQ